MAALLNPTSRRLATAACRRISTPAAADPLVSHRKFQGLPPCPSLVHVPGSQCAGLSIRVLYKSPLFINFFAIRNQELVVAAKSLSFNVLLCGEVLNIRFCGIPSISSCLGLSLQKWFTNLEPEIGPPEFEGKHWLCPCWNLWQRDAVPVWLMWVAGSVRCLMLRKGTTWLEARAVLGELAWQRHLLWSLPTKENQHSSSLQTQHDHWVIHLNKYMMAYVVDMLLQLSFYYLC